MSYRSSAELPMIALFVTADYPNQIIDKVPELESDTRDGASLIWLATPGEGPEYDEQPTPTPIASNWSSHFVGWTPQKCYDWLDARDDLLDVSFYRLFVMDDQLAARSAIQFCVNWTEDEVNDMRITMWDAQNPDHFDEHGEKDFSRIDPGIEVGVDWIAVNAGWAAVTMIGCPEDIIQLAFREDRSLWMSDATSETWYENTCAELGINVDSDDEERHDSRTEDATNGAIWAATVAMQSVGASTF